VGAGCAGHIDSQRGVVLTNSNLPDWDHHPLRDVLQARLGLPVLLENDANCAAWAEFRYGAAAPGTCAMSLSAPGSAWAS
jgi:glucokinase